MNTAAIVDIKGALLMSRDSTIDTSMTAVPVVCPRCSAPECDLIRTKMIESRDTESRPFRLAFHLLGLECRDHAVFEKNHGTGA